MIPRLCFIFAFSPMMGPVGCCPTGTTPDGLTVQMAASPFVRGYSKDGTTAHYVHPDDFVVVQAPEGLRVYFVLYTNTVVPETALYSVLNTSIK